MSPWVDRGTPVRRLTLLTFAAPARRHDGVETAGRLPSREDTMMQRLWLSPIALATAARYARLALLGIAIAQTIVPWFPIGTAEANHVACAPPPPGQDPGSGSVDSSCSDCGGGCGK